MTNYPSSRCEQPVSADRPPMYFPAALGILMVAGVVADMKNILTQDGAPFGRPVPMVAPRPNRHAESTEQSQPVLDASVGAERRVD